MGDSVTQGCFECYIKEDCKIETVFDYKSAFSTRLREMLNILYPSVQVNIINSGISGDGTENGDIYLCVEAFFEKDNSKVQVKYKIYKNRDFVDVDVTVFRQDIDKVLRLAIPVKTKSKLNFGKYEVKTVVFDGGFKEIKELKKRSNYERCNF